MNLMIVLEIEVSGIVLCILWIILEMLDQGASLTLDTLDGRSTASNHKSDILIVYIDPMRSNLRVSLMLVIGDHGHHRNLMTHRHLVPWHMTCHGHHRNLMTRKLTGMREGGRGCMRSVF